VPRTALVERLLRSATTPVVCLVAPPGYGKTTVLAQWTEQKERVAWVGVDRHDNDPIVLLTYVAAALDRIEPIDPTVFRALALPGTAAVATIVARLAAALQAMTGPVVLVLDNLEALDDQPSQDVVAELAIQFSARPLAGSQLVLAARARPPLPMARLRALGGVVEVGVEELSMDQREAQLLLEGAGVPLTEAEAAKLHRQTEGWPVGLYLAALSRKVGSPHRVEGVGFSGEDRFMADYLGSELLAHLPPETVSFLTRTAVLERLSGPLCDAVLDTSGSGEMLESLAESNLLLVPLDRRREWYRYHHLFRELLHAELERREQELVGQLHLRAASWYEANGLPEAAIDHAQAADDADRVARLVASLIRPATAAGRVDTVRRWLAWFQDQGLIDRYPAVAVQGTWIFALWGQPAAAERWADAAERGRFHGTLPDGSTMDGQLALLRALLCRGGVDQMGADAQAGLAGLSPASGWRAPALLLQGASSLLGGEPDRADPILADAVEVGISDHALPAVAVALAQRGLVAIHHHDWDQAERFADQAFTIVQRGHLDDYVLSAVVYAVAARTAAHRGEAERAQGHLARAARLRPQLTYATPHLAVQTLLELGRAYLGIGDAAGAKVTLKEANDILRLRPDLGVLPKEADELQSQLDTVHEQIMGASSLTRAELCLLPLLATHLTFWEIGERPCISRHTVKAHAGSVYRKLGVSSRSEAVKRAQELGLGT
jgi:LuxR family transcriptional regulator, maltose regulon positive regulatory protein